MATEMATTIISGVISLIGTFGAILLKDQLDRRRTASSDCEPSSRQGGRQFGFAMQSLILVGFVTGIGYFGQGHLQYEIGGIYLFYWLNLGACLLLLGYFVRAGSRSWLAYQLGIAGLWSGMLAGFSARGGVSADGLSVVANSWLASAIVGALIFALTRRRRAS